MNLSSWPPLAAVAGTCLTNTTEKEDFRQKPIWATDSEVGIAAVLAWYVLFGPVEAYLQFCTKSPI